MSYKNLEPLIKKTGSTLTSEAFQSIINVVFHDFEANHYDEMHSDMWGSLQQQIDLLVGDLLSSDIYVAKSLSLLDVGCGTGLSTQILLQSKLGNQIDKITLLDTSSNMLKQAEEKAKKWNKKFSLINSDISSLNEKYDVIIICSVLHHIPLLEPFLKQIDAIMNSGGILIHLQDPNGDYLNDLTYQKRVNEYNLEFHNSNKKPKPINFIPKKWKNFMKRILGRKNYIDLVNDKLLADKVIKNRMTSDEIWSVTDIHVETKQNTINKGISLKFLQKQLENFTLINQRSYGFYGDLISDLPDNFKKNEEEMIANNERNGRNISCIWIKK